MRLKVDDGFIRNEADIIVGTVQTDGAFSKDVKRTIELGSELIPIAEEFIGDVNSGSLKPRTNVRKFEAVIEKYD